MEIATGGSPAPLLASHGPKGSIGAQSSPNRRKGGMGGCWGAAKHGPRVVPFCPGLIWAGAVAGRPSLPAGLSIAPAAALGGGLWRASGTFSCLSLRESWQNLLWPARTLRPTATELGGPSCDMLREAETQGFRARWGSSAGVACTSNRGCPNASEPSGRPVHRPLVCGPPSGSPACMPAFGGAMWIQ